MAIARAGIAKMDILLPKSLNSLGSSLTIIILELFFNIVVDGAVAGNKISLRQMHWRHHILERAEDVYRNVPTISEVDSHSIWKHSPERLR